MKEVADHLSESSKGASKVFTFYLAACLYYGITIAHVSRTYPLGTTLKLPVISAEVPASTMMLTLLPILFILMHGHFLIALDGLGASVQKFKDESSKPGNAHGAPYPFFLNQAWFEKSGASTWISRACIVLFGAFVPLLLLLSQLAAQLYIPSLALKAGLIGAFLIDALLVVMFLKKHTATWFTRSSLGLPALKRTRFAGVLLLMLFSFVVTMPMSKVLSLDSIVTSNLNLSGMRVETIPTIKDLSFANFSNADLTNCNLSGRNLRGANLRGAVLDGANLTDANLMGADLTDASLKGALLDKTDLSGATLVNTRLNSATLIQVEFVFATLIRIQAQGADLRLSEFHCATIQGSNFVLADLTGAQFQGAHILDSDFVAAELSGVSFTGTVLERSDFRGCTIKGSKLGASVWIDSALTGSEVSNSVMSDKEPATWEVLRETALTVEETARLGKGWLQKSTASIESARDRTSQVLGSAISLPPSTKLYIAPDDNNSAQKPLFLPDDVVLISATQHYQGLRDLLKSDSKILQPWVRRSQRYADRLKNLDSNSAIFD